MPYFDVWWQGLVFGLVNLVGMLVIANLFHGMWEKYEDKLDAPELSGPQNDTHHH